MPMIAVSVADNVVLSRAIDADNVVLSRAIDADNVVPQTR